jgi:hypothetical protein
MRITMNILKSESGLAKGYIMKKDKYLSTSRPFLLFATMSKRNAFSSGLPKKEASESNGLKKGYNLRPGGFTSDKRFNEPLVLLWY